MKLLINSGSKTGIFIIVFVVSSLPSTKAKKVVKSETTAGSGAGYKSKEFISDNEASSSTDSDDKPLKRKEAKEESDSEVGEVKRLKSSYCYVILVIIVIFIMLL